MNSMATHSGTSDKRLANIFLASQSPRRRELLQQIGVRFELLPVDIDEAQQADETPQACVQRLALEKARAGRAVLPAGRSQPVMGADTLVVCGGAVLGKPADREAALAMLQSLSGTTHQVITAVALAADHEASCTSTSDVTFRRLTVAECEAGRPVSRGTRPGRMRCRGWPRCLSAGSRAVTRVLWGYHCMKRQPC